MPSLPHPHCLISKPHLRGGEGYIALLSVLMVGAIASMAIIVLFVTSLSTTLNSGDIGEGALARAMADSCAETALQWLTDKMKTSDSCSPEGTECQTIWSVQDQGTCTIQAVSHINSVGADTVWRIRTTGSGVLNALTKFVEVEAYRKDTGDPMTGSAVVILQWNECLDFSEPTANDCLME